MVEDGNTQNWSFWNLCQELLNQKTMKNYTRLIAYMAGAIGLIGIVESIANFSLFQTFFSVGLIWLAFAVYEDVKHETDGETNV